MRSFVHAAFVGSILMGQLLMCCIGFTGASAKLTQPSLQGLQRFRTVNRMQNDLDGQDEGNIVMQTMASSGSMNQKEILNQIAAVALPALAVCLAEPLMTLIDMYFVSQSSGGQATAKLAALSVNGAVFNVIAAATYPLCTGSTALVSRALAKSAFNSPQKATNDQVSKSSKSTAENRDLQKIMLNGVFLSTLSGLSILTCLQLFGGQILRRGFNLSENLFSSAWSYMTIRSISLPFALITYVIIGFSLGVQNVLVPAVSIFSSALTNIVGDFLLCRVYGRGLDGAAVATTLAAAVSTIASLGILISRYIAPSPKPSPTSTPPLTSDNPLTILARSIRFFVSQLDLATLRQFFSTSMLLLLGTFSNTLTYSAGSKISAAIVSPSSSTAISSALMTHHMAAHQIVMQLWWFISFFSTPLSMAAQALMPRLVATQLPAAYVTRNTLLTLGSVVGLLCMAITALSFRYLAPLTFTSDATVLRLIAQVTPSALLSMFVICLTTTLDGLFIGIDAIGDYILASVVSSAASWLFYATQALPRRLGVVGAWQGMLIFSVVRLFVYLLRMSKLRYLGSPKPETNSNKML